MVAGAFAALAQVLAMSIANNVSARSGSAAAVLAVQKMEQLRALPWGSLASGALGGGHDDVRRPLAFLKGMNLDLVLGRDDDRPALQRELVRPR